MIPMSFRRFSVFIAALTLWVLADSLAAAQENAGMIFAASDGKGHVSLFWFPPTSQWPAGGWKLSDSSGKLLVPQIKLGESAALEALSVEDRDTIQRLSSVFAVADSSPQRKNLLAILSLRVFSEPNFARAMGLSWTLDNVAAGSRTYRVEGLDASGKTIVQVTSPPVDSAQASALPSAPDSVQAKVDRDGVSLFWNPPADNRQRSVVAYAVERDGGGQSAAPVTAKPAVVGLRWDPKKPLVLDRNAPANEMLTYRVFSVDVFGRRSEGSAIRIFFPDFHALEPPDPVTASAGVGKVVVSWKAANKPNLAGYVIERAFLHDGPYEALAAQPLPPSTAQYEDDEVRGGTTYYYRVRAVNSRGDLGNPSAAATAQPKNPGGPPKVEGLAADVGQTRVRLTWKPVAYPVSGYFIERRALTGLAQTENWVRLNSHVTPEPQYDDYLGLTSDTKMEYRILAVAFDNAEAPPSEAIQVQIADRSLPSEPSITGTSGADGKVTISFEPALPAEKTAQFLVLRSGRAEDLGVVLGDPLPASARTFTDSYVSAGNSYWYRLVAVDKSGNRSDPTRPVVVRVGPPAIPKPAALTLQTVNTPFPHVALQFPQVPAGFRVIVERQDQPNGPWLRIAGPMVASAASDNGAPPSKTFAYRISYIAANGAIGPPSDVVSAGSSR
ncbi:MAG: fibronectin type III domain-containing protein [Terriglobales bacterium]